MKVFSFLSAFVLLPLWLAAQSGRPVVHVKRCADPIVLDGRLEEKSWKLADKATDFWEQFPEDSLPAKYQTEISFCRDDEYLYVGVKCYTPGNAYVVPSLRYDYMAFGTDFLSLIFDTFNDKTNAFTFGINPLGVQRDALLSGGGNRLEDFSSSWDNKWKGESFIGDHWWSAEMAIPFSTLRFQEGGTKWRFGCFRFDTQSNERSAWIEIPRNQWLFNLAYTGDMIWEEPLPPSGANVSVIPYLSGSYAQDAEEPVDKPFAGGAGLDAKIGITSGLNLDLTVNPDFSQVEVDRQVTNLSRFELFFPEKRQFFLENADLFGGFGFSDMNPFFSRRIGVAIDTATGQNVQNPIWGGLRLSGKLNEGLRVGLLDMQTAPDRENDLPSFNYGVLALQKKLFARSNIGFIFVNKQATGADSSETYDPFNRVLGLDYNLASADNTWTGKVFYHHALLPRAGQDGGGTKGAGQHGALLTYNSRKFRFDWEHRWVSEDFDAQTGFIQRHGYFAVQPKLRLFFYPEGSRHINRHGPGIDYKHFWDTEGRNTDRVMELYWVWELLANDALRLSLDYNYIFLQDDFDPSRSDATPLPAGTAYEFWAFRMRYRSDPRKRLRFRLEPSYGQYYNGSRLSLQGNASLRFQPYVSVSLQFSYNRIRLPGPYASADLLLLGPRLDITFTKKLFLTAFMQYNNQLDNVNFNIRFQWRYQPVSDFYVVYTDNYAASDFGNKNRALVLKWTYWFNL